jgi:hypothetical protein
MTDIGVFSHIVRRGNCPFRLENGKRCKNKTSVWLNYANHPELKYRNRYNTICRYHAEWLGRCRYITKEGKECGNAGRRWFSNRDYPNDLVCEYHYDIEYERRRKLGKVMK